MSFPSNQQNEEPDGTNQKSSVSSSSSSSSNSTWSNDEARAATMQDHQSEETSSTDTMHVEEDDHLKMYEGGIEIFETFNVFEFTKDVANTDYLADTPLRVYSDVDSLVFLTQEPDDLDCLKIKSLTIQFAKKNIKPLNVRPCVKKNPGHGFKPFYPKKEMFSRGPTSLARFPSFTIGSIEFNGGIKAIMSLHVLDPNGLGTECGQDKITTWLYANNLALKETQSGKAQMENQYNAEFDLNKASKNRGWDKDMTFHNDNAIDHLKLVFEALYKIYQAGQHQDQTNVTADAAYTLRYNSVLLAQACGFKLKWEEKEEVSLTVDLTDHDWLEQANQILCEEVEKKHKRGKEFFFHEQTEPDPSTLIALDIALTFKSSSESGLEWDILPNGIKAQELVNEMVKMKRDHDAIELEAIYEDEGEEDPLGAVVELMDEEGRREENSDEQSQREIFDLLTNSTKPNNRARYCLFGTTGSIGNAQSKAGIRLDVNHADDDDDDDDDDYILWRISQSQGDCNIASPIVQIYQPYHRFQLRRHEVKKHAEFYGLTRKLTSLMSEFEKLFVMEGRTDPTLEVVSTLRDLCKIVDQWKAGLLRNKLYVRHEMTFVSTTMESEIKVPITSMTSPLLCLQFAKKRDIVEKVSHVVDINTEILKKVITLLSRAGGGLDCLDKSQKTTICAASEFLCLLVGAAGGARGSILKTSLDHSNETYYSNKFWMPHSDFVIRQERDRENLFPYSLNTRLMYFPSMKQTTENMTPLNSALDHVNQNLSGYLTATLPRTLKYPSPVRNTACIIYHVLLEEVGIGNGSGEATIFDCIDFSKKIASYEAANRILNRIALAVLSLYRTEWSKRLMEKLERAFSRLPSQAFPLQLKNKRSEMEEALCLVGTKAKLQNFIDFYLDSVWPFPDRVPFDSDDCVTSASEIFERMCGTNINDVLSDPISNNQGWKNSGVPFIISIIQRLFRKILVDDTLEQENPFRSLTCLKFEIASAMINAHQQEDDGNCFIWHTVPSKLEVNGKGILVKYNPMIEKLSQSTDQQRIKSVDNNFDTMKSDCFVATFLTFDSMTKDPGFQKLEEEFKDISGQRDDGHLYNSFHIIYMHFLIVHFFDNHEQSGKDSLYLGSECLKHIYPNEKRMKSAIKSLVKLTDMRSVKKKITSGEIEITADTTYKSFFDEVLHEILQKKESRAIFDLVARNQRSPFELMNSTNLSLTSAQKPSIDLTVDNQNLLIEQKKALRDNKRHLAIMIMVKSGIFSPELSDSLISLRTNLRTLISELRAEENLEQKNNAKTNLVEFVKNHKLPGCHSKHQAYDFSDVNEQDKLLLFKE